MLNTIILLGLIAILAVAGYIAHKLVNRESSLPVYDSFEDVDDSTEELENSDATIGNVSIITTFTDNKK